MTKKYRATVPAVIEFTLYAENEAHARELARSAAKAPFHIVSLDETVLHTELHTTPTQTEVIEADFVQ